MEIYGKIKNGTLIIASDIFVRNDELLFAEENKYLLKEKGYKPVIYTNPPQNREGYILKNTWVENSQEIIQKWEYNEIQDDFSAKLFVKIRNFDKVIEEVKKEVIDNYKSNDEKIKSILKKHKMIAFLYSNKKGINTKEMLKLLSDCELNLKKFFTELDMISILEENNFYISDFFMYYDKERKFLGKNKHIENFEQNNLIYPQYFKRNLSEILSLKMRTKLSNKTMYDMAFIYLFTSFDEILLRIIQIVCMHEKKWLISNSNLTSMEILSCDTTDEIHNLLIEKKVDELSWGSYIDKLKFLINRGITIDKENMELFYENILYLSMKRNVIVHNGGIWNKTTKEKLKNTKYYEHILTGNTIDYSIESFEKACVYIKKSIKYIYYQICDKFNLLDEYTFLSEE